MRALQLKLLGHFECSLGKDERISLPMRKADVLLAFLALAPGLRHPRERLINLLWSDRSDDQARNSLRQCLSSIKKSLGDAADLILLVDRNTVSLKGELIEVDAHEFERLALEGDYESLNTAASLYQGEFLEGISIRDPACQEWLDGERARFKRQFIEILTNLAETQLVTHDYSHAIKSAERLVEQDPLVEAGWRLLMRSHFENGDRNHALLAFKRCSEVLRKELDVEPEAKTAELQEQIKRGRIDAVAAKAVGPAADSQPTQDAAARENSILVLPLKNLSNDPDQQYFSDGLTESIITGLSRFQSLRVHSRHSSFAAAGRNLSIREIGEQFDTRYVVEGSVRRSATHLRISSTLVDTNTGEQIWGDQFDKKLDQTFELEDELTRAIVAAVKGKIDATDEKIALQKPAKDIGSYDLLLRGYHHMTKFNPGDNLKAIELLDRFLEIEPDNAIAHNHLYQTYLTNYLEGWSAPREDILGKARYHVDRALDLMPDNALIQADYGELLSFTGKLDQAEIHLDRVSRLNPNDPEALVTAGGAYANIGLVDKGIELIETCYRLDPYHPWLDWVAGGAYFNARRYGEALRAFSKMPNPVDDIYGWIAACHYRLGDRTKAQQYLQTFIDTARRNMAEPPAGWEAWRNHVAVWSGPEVGENIDNALQALIEMGMEHLVQSPGTDSGGESLHSIAVLPFDNLSGDAQQEYFSDGISESIILHLSAFPGLKVKSRNSSFAFKQQLKSLGEISDELEVKYLVEGSIRKSSDRIRITVQLIEADSGDQLWGKRYDASLDNLFDLEEELSRSIAATVTGQIVSDLQRIALTKGAKDQRAYDLLLAGSYHVDKLTGPGMAAAIPVLDRCLELDPENARAHALLYTCHCMNSTERWVEDFEAAFERAEKHIKRAMELGPEQALVQLSFAEYLVFRSEFEQSHKHLNIALEINPNDAETYAVQSFNHVMTSDFEAGLESAETGLRLDPYHPWCDWVLAEAQFYLGRYEDCLHTIDMSKNAPGTIRTFKVASNIELGRMDRARAALKEYVEQASKEMAAMPRNRDEWYRYLLDNAPYSDSNLNEKLVDYLVQAGLEEELAKTSPVEDRDDMPSIAVLPFENMSGDPEQEHFADGITTDIVSILSKFRHMRTVSSYSTLLYKDKKTSIAEIADQQNVRYLLQGSVRKSGDKIRVNAELIDSTDESICWNERYDRDLHDLFAVQDEIAKNITIAMKAQIDDGEMAMYRSKGATDIRAWELTMAAIDLQDTYIRKNILEARAMALEATRLDPEYANAWVTLGWTYWQEAYAGWSDDVEALIAEADKATRHAMDLEPNYGEAWAQAGMNHRMKHDADAVIAACLKAVELEPGSAEVNALTAWAYLDIGDFNAARRHEQNMRELCPILPNWYYLVSGAIEQRCGNLDRAIEIYQQGLEVEPDSPLCHFYLIDALMDKGDESRAAQLADEIRALDKSMTGKGLVHANSCDAGERQRFYENLAKFDLV